MSTFSGTNLPPILRVGTSSDQIIRIAEGTLGNQSIPSDVTINQVHLWGIPEAGLLHDNDSNKAHSYRKSRVNRRR